ncbi:MAG: type II toxin-antitoxin system YafQ family toxin [Pseudomonadota bacterium]
MASAYGKRANPPLASENTKDFQKDWDKLLKSGRYEMGRLTETMLLIISNQGALPPEYKDHQLAGEWADFRECHVGGDFLLIYQLVPGKKAWGAVIFARAGTHSELF